jgi:hypothetical protein
MLHRYYEIGMITDILETRAGLAGAEGARDQLQISLAGTLSSRANSARDAARAASLAVICVAISPCARTNRAISAAE